MFKNMGEPFRALGASKIVCLLPAVLHYVRAAGLGLEPRLDDSESSVLPLDDPAMFIKFSIQHFVVRLSVGAKTPTTRRSRNIYMFSS